MLNILVHKCFSSLQNEVNLELEEVFTWLVSNEITLNLKKSKFMMVTNTNKQNILDFCIKINNAPLENCKSYKYLGVVIDEKLNWDAHIKYITPKISKHVVS